MDFITVIIIGLVIYSLIKKVKKRIQPGNTISGGEIFTGRDSITFLKEMLKQYKEIQDPKQIWELERKIKYGKRPENMNAEGAAAVEGVWAEAAASGTEGTSGGEGTQGIEGTSDYEGTQGIEGTSGYEGAQGIEGISGYESTRRIERIPDIAYTPQREAAYGFLKYDFHPNEQELLQGVIWAEVLGRPRALRPYRSR
jgi:hypothetical protein